jgi:hypothetical protein
VDEFRGQFLSGAGVAGDENVAAGLGDLPDIAPDGIE